MSVAPLTVTNSLSFHALQQRRHFASRSSFLQGKLIAVMETKDVKRAWNLGHPFFAVGNTGLVPKDGGQILAKSARNRMVSRAWSPKRSIWSSATDRSPIPGKDRFLRRTHCTQGIHQSVEYWRPNSSAMRRRSARGRENISDAVQVNPFSNDIEIRPITGSFWATQINSR